MGDWRSARGFWRYKKWKSKIRVLDAQKVATLLVYMKFGLYILKCYIQIKNGNINYAF